MRWAAVALLGLSTLWFVALVIAAFDVLPAALAGQHQGQDDPAVVIAYGVGAVILGGCSVLLVGPLVRSGRAGRGPPPWARRVAFSCAGVLVVAAVAVAVLGRPELILMSFPALAFAMAGVELRRGPSAGAGD
jgi:membrane protease YdiL (CAAX protease family)